MYNQNPYSQYPYTNYTYPNYNNRQFMQPQQMAQPQAQMQQSMQPVMPTLCYAKMEEAKPYIITAPNSSMLFIDREKGKALLKTTDNVCNSYPRYFNIVETDENGNALQEKKEEKPIDFSQFVTISQYNDLVSQLDALKKVLVSVNSVSSKQNENTAKSDDFSQGKGNTQQNK